MANVLDILLDESNDLQIIGGDFVINFSDQQHVKNIIEAERGHYKEFPGVGVGISNYLNSTGKEQEIQREVKLQLENDGYKIAEIIVLYPLDIYIDGERI